MLTLRLERGSLKYKKITHSYGYELDLFTYEALNQVVKNARTAIEDELPGNYSNASLTLGITGFNESSVIVLGDCSFIVGVSQNGCRGYFARERIRASCVVHS